MKQRLIMIAVSVALVACSSSKKKEQINPPSAANPATETFNREKDCNDPKWKETHLGLWYNVCRDNRSL